MALVRLFPEMHSAVTTDGDVRRALLRRFPYSVVYEAVGVLEVVILACRHVRQDEIDWGTARRDG